MRDHLKSIKSDRGIPLLNYTEQIIKDVFCQKYSDIKNLTEDRESGGKPVLGVIT